MVSGKGREGAGTLTSKYPRKAQDEKGRSKLQRRNKRSNVGNQKTSNLIGKETKLKIEALWRPERVLPLYAYGTVISWHD